MEYDLVIVGAGPSGLALAQCCSHITNKILIIDKESTIGGCHGVRRVPVMYKDKQESVFTEHGPRVYSTTYKMFRTLLKEMDINFGDLFTPYNFSIATIGGETIWSTLSYTELAFLAKDFLLLLIDNDHGKNVSMQTYMTNNDFTNEAISIIDRICRLTDGASADRYTLNEFLELFNQQFFYSLYQPKSPNDKGLFKTWRKFLENKGVEFSMSSEVVSLNKNEISIKKNNLYKKISSEKIVIATPPLNLVKILENSSPDIKNSLGDLNELKKWSNDTSYIDYISVTFHWDTKLSLPKIYGFPRSEWGIAFIVLSDYMQFDENVSKTVISAAVTITDQMSTRLNKTADECDDQQMLITEMFDQLKTAFPDIPDPTFSLMSPGVYYDKQKQKWISKDTAFVASAGYKTLPFNTNVDHLFTLGTHNGTHFYKFTSMESAVTNAINLSLILYPQLRSKYTVSSTFTLRDFFVYLLILSFVIVVFFRSF